LWSYISYKDSLTSTKKSYKKVYESQQTYNVTRQHKHVTNKFTESTSCPGKLWTIFTSECTSKSLSAIEKPQKHWNTPQN